MARQPISRAQRQRIAAIAGYRCAYCHTAERIIGPFLEVDHIVPEAAGGQTVDYNLTLACPLCNSHKSDRTHFPHPDTGELTPLFHQISKFGANTSDGPRTAPSFMAKLPSVSAR